MNDRLFAHLRPEGLDEVVEEAYGRRRSADLARAFRTPPASPRRFAPPRSLPMSRRLSLLLVTGTATAGLAAAIVVPGLVSGASETGRPGTGALGAATTPSQSRPDPTAVAASPLDARSFLLAAAETAAREPATTGRYWYTRTRTISAIRAIPGAFEEKVQLLQKELEDKKTAAGGDAAAIAAAEKEFEDEVGRLKGRAAKSAGMPFSAATSDTSEVWRAREKGGINRNVTRPDAKVTFASPEDEAKWKAMGSPDLVEGARPRTNEDRMDRVLSIDNPGLTMRNVSLLPTGKDALKRRLRTMYEQGPASQGPNRSTFAVYLWQTGADLLTAPVTPGTRAALFRVLAEQPGITSKGRSADALGRTGVVLSTTAPGDESTQGDVEFRMIIDERTAELLQIEVRDRRPIALLSQAFEQTGWANRLGERPAG
ncbi:hypothetical protein [Microbispora sp. NPDC049125]|uniref:hypothetical protein n=1 Tax=Microbispora sp. NPDC049125 TaxID=3154929 RepID=UPI003467E1D1